MRPALLFGGLAFILSWTYWLAVIASQHGWLAAHVPLTPVGAFGPALAAVLTAALLRGRHGVTDLLRTVTAWPRHWRSLAAAVLAWPSFVLAALLTAGIVGQSLTPTGAVPISRLPLFFLEIFVFTSLAEELGWRGFLLPQLITRIRAVVAALVVGLAWAVWHLPLFYISGTAQSGIPFGLFVVTIIAASFIYAGLYLWGQPSLLPVLVLHTFQDVSLGLAPVLWPVAGSSAAFWYGYFGVVVAAGLGVAVWLVVHDPIPSPATA